MQGKRRSRKNKVYTSPKVVELGRLAELTRAALGSQPDLVADNMIGL